MPWLPECVASVQAQRSDVEVEHLILDGGSTDGSREWLEAHRDQGDRVVLEPDEGQTAAMIRGFDMATGEILGWLNSDDTFEPGALAKVHAAFEANAAAVMVTGACILVDPNGYVVGAIPTPPEPTLRGLLRHPANPAQPATLFRAEAYRKAGGLDRHFDLAMDVDLWLRLAETGPLCALPEQVLARFRVHPNAKSVAGAAAASREDLRARRRHGTSLRSPAGLALIKAGYLRPVLRPPKRALGWLALRLVGS